MAIKTRLTLTATPGRPYAAFEAKALFIIYALYNFKAKARAFNFNAKSKTFNFNARNRNTNFIANIGA
jgi:hypothetical protein